LKASPRRRRRNVTFFVAVAALAVAAAACMPAAPAPPAPQPVATTQPPPPALVPAPGGISTPGIAVHISTANPSLTKVIDFPDPSVTKVGGTYYAYSTGSGFNALQVIKSTDLQSWQWVGDPFSGGSSGWAHLFANTWGPTMVQLGSKYVLYYSSLSQVGNSAGMHCIGRAVSASPEGPFVDEETQPFFCDTARGGSVDPSPIVTNGRVYLTYQSFGVASIGEPTRLWTRQLSADGLSIASTPTQNLATLGWSFEPPVIEGPSMMPSPDGGYLLFYAAGLWTTANYKVAVAWCPTPTAACTRFYSTPVLATRGTMAGPGGPGVFQDPSGAWRLAFAAWTSPAVGYPAGGARSFRILPITFPSGGHKPKVG